MATVAMVIFSQSLMDRDGEVTTPKLQYTIKTLTDAIDESIRLCEFLIQQVAEIRDSGEEKRRDDTSTPTHNG